MIIDRILYLVWAFSGVLGRLQKVKPAMRLGNVGPHAQTRFVQESRHMRISDFYALYFDTNMSRRLKYINTLRQAEY